MSKSYGNTIGLFEEESAMRKKIMSLKTDSTPVEAPKAIENSTILALYKLVADPADYAQMETDFRAGGAGYGEFKKRLFAALWDYFAPMRERREEILAVPGYVEMVLRDGREKANRVAEEVMSQGALGDRLMRMRIFLLLDSAGGKTADDKLLTHHEHDRNGHAAQNG